MFSFILILLSLASIALIIFYLHKNHIRKTLEIAEYDIALTPLENDIASNKVREGIQVIDEIRQSPLKDQTWAEEIKALRDSGSFPEALALSRRQYPKLLAYRQTLITLRATLKKDSSCSEESLSDLYQTAVSGDLVKIHNSGLKNTNDINLRISALGSPREYWDTLGYENLDLLTKTDRKLLASHWGEPERHCTIESLLSTQAAP